MLVSGKELFAAAQAGKYAVGAFNLNNMEILQAIVEAAEEENSPVILQASQGGIKYAGIEYVAGMAKIAAQKVRVPIALNIDHGTSFDQIAKCVRHGFTALMFDGSKLPFEENIAVTKKVVEIARPNNISVEAELGKIGGTEDDIVVDEREATFTDPKEAYEFATRSECDALAVAIGTAHGVYKGEPKLDFDRLREIHARLSIPIVLHGASGVPDDAIKTAISLGVAKINIDTELRLAFSEAVRQAVEKNPKEIDPRKLIGPAKERMKEAVKAKMRLFGSSNKA